MVNQQYNDESLRELALFAGAGGGILGGHLLGWRTVCAVEYNAYARSVLLARQNDGTLPPFPIWDDVRTFDGKPWRGIVDVVSGGFPCQDISVAGGGTGIDGERSGLWKHQARIIREVEPRFAWVENSPALTIRGLGTVLGDLAEMGFDARWGVLGGKSVGASHQRDRIWILASNTYYARLEGREQWSKTGLFSVDNILASRGFPRSLHDLPEPILLGTGNGMAHRVDRTKAIGNGQIPAVCAAAWRILSQ